MYWVSLKVIGKVEIALEESGLQYERYEINLREKPEWYTPKINAQGKVRYSLDYLSRSKN